ncbi:hypothetical protein H072_6658 [Dactylellina haptotyla CBS 200.50]|uniref:F-box domain-containing protein n=1 Tax=Dactylellina haptotyla (strain CBS 200.50) TaxID=1284197 RepID=S8BVZ7_DACHA|nr:hypothetical protein H072_6658 [Dactylellina haptotyla CBS 200.50]
MRDRTLAVTRGQWPRKNRLLQLPTEICYAILACTPADALKEFARCSRACYYLSFAARFKGIVLNERSFKLVSPGGLFEPIKNSIRSIRVHVKDTSTVTNLRTHLEMLGCFPNLTEIEIKYTYPAWMEKNLFVAILHSLTALECYQNLNRLRIFFHLRRLKRPLLDDEEDEDEDTDRTASSLVSSDISLVAASMEPGPAKDALLKPKSPYHLMEPEYFKTECANLSKEDQTFLGPFLTDDQVRRVLTRELRFPPRLDELFVWVNRTKNRWITPHRLFYYQLVPYSTVKHLNLWITDLNLAPGEDEGDGTVLSFPNIEKVTLHLDSGLEHAGLRQLHTRFLDVKHLCLYNNIREGHEALKGLPRLPHLQYLELEWPTYSDEQNMAPQDLAEDYIQPMIRTGKTPLLETIKFHGVRRNDGVEEEIFIIYTNLRKENITCSGAIREHQYIDIWPTPESWTPTPEPELPRLRLRRLDDLTDEDEDVKRSEDESSSLSGSEQGDYVEPEGGEGYYTYQGASQSNYTYQDDDPEDDEEYFAEDDDPEEPQNYPEEDEPELQVNCDNPYRTSTKDHNYSAEDVDESMYGTQTSQYNNSQSFTSNRQQQPAGGVGGESGESVKDEESPAAATASATAARKEADKKAKEALRIRNLYRR